MEREIKFRAWDKQGNKMVHSGDYWKPHDRVLTSGQVNVSSRGITVNVTHEDSSKDYCVGDDGRTYYYHWDYDKLYFQDVELMQYTGLKDKNGKEIYEGDVVEMTANKTVMTIEFRDAGFCFCTRGMNPTPLYRNGIGYCPCQVIGNIYENPELIKN